MKDVFKFDGGYGPDRLWIKEEIATSESYYNPETGEGGALKRIEEHYKRALERAINNLPWEKDFTWMSHFIVDVLSPTHHFGKKIKSVKRRDNWDDPYFHLKNYTSLKNRHMVFEATINFWQVFGRRRKPEFKKLEEIESDGLDNFIKKTIKETRELGLYREFLGKGFSRDLWHRINKELIPRIEKALATIWLALFREVRKGRAAQSNLD